MKLLILSDCHANVDALRAVWKKEKDSDASLFAGDMLDFGFSPKETVRWFMEHRDCLYAVLGNHDEALLARRGEQVTDPYENFQKLNLSGLDEEEWEFLASLPHELTVTFGDTDFYICHMADELSADDCYIEGQLPTRNIRALFLERYAKKFPDSKAQNKVIVYGHSHQQWVLSAGERAQIINPGIISAVLSRCGALIIWCSRTGTIPCGIWILTPGIFTPWQNASKTPSTPGWRVPSSANKIHTKSLFGIQSRKGFFAVSAQ